MTNKTTTQAAWIAYDNARAATGSDAAGLQARATVLRGPPVEGPAEHPASFSVRSTARLAVAS